MLCDSTGFLGRDVCLSDVVEKAGLAVVDVAHDGDDRRTLNRSADLDGGARVNLWLRLWTFGERKFEAVGGDDAARFIFGERIGNRLHDLELADQALLNFCLWHAESICHVTGGAIWLQSDDL